MSGMLQPNDHYREAVRRRQQEAHEWARARAMGNIARPPRQRRAQVGHHRDHHHTVRMHLRALRMHLRALVSPLAVRHHH